MSLRGYVKKTRPATWQSAFPPAPEPERRPTRLRAVSPSNRSEVAAYNREARADVAAARARGALCPVMAFLDKIVLVEEVHHMYGKRGRLRRWKPGQLLVSREGHMWIDTHMNEAREHGWLCPLGCFDDYKRAVAHHAMKELMK